ncbi:hypothetical protein ACLOJK_005355 [Asimina triloba]
MFKSGQGSRETDLGKAAPLQRNEEDGWKTWVGRLRFGQQRIWGQGRRRLSGKDGCKPTKMVKSDGDGVTVGSRRTWSREDLAMGGRRLDFSGLGRSNNGICSDGWARREENGGEGRRAGKTVAVGGGRRGREGEEDGHGREENGGEARAGARAGWGCWAAQGRGDGEGFQGSRARGGGGGEGEGEGRGRASKSIAILGRLGER